MVIGVVLAVATLLPAWLLARQSKRAGLPVADMNSPFGLAVPTFFLIGMVGVVMFLVSLIVVVAG